MSKALSSLIFGLFLVPFVAFGQTVLYQSLESGGGIVVEDFSNDYFLIGSFVSPGNFQLNSLDGTFIGVQARGVGASCSALFYIASSTDAQLDTMSSLWSSQGFAPGGLNSFPTTGKFASIPGGGTVGNLVVGETYGIYAWSPNCNSGDGIIVEADELSLIYYGYLSWDGDYREQFDFDAQVTRIISVDPFHNETIATSTSMFLGASINVNSIDYDGDMFLRFRYARNQDFQASIANTELLWTEIDVPILAPGNQFIQATTSILRTGQYSYRVQIRDPSITQTILSWFSLGDSFDTGLLVGTSTQFIVVERTFLDQFIEDMASTTTAVLGNPGDLATDLSACNPLSFEAVKCFTALFMPSQFQVEHLVTQLNESVFRKAPFGYVTRLVEIMTSSATTSLPVISYTFGDESPLSGEELSFDFSETVNEAGVILSTTLVSDREDEQSIWDIFMPFWVVIVYITLFIMILHDLTGIYNHNRSINRDL